MSKFPTKENEVDIANKQPTDYLLAGAQLNDSLLQSYRQIHLTIQSIFVAIGVGLFVAVIVFNELIQVVLATVVLIVLSGVSLYILYAIRKIILARGEDVSFWHRKLILAEQDLPAERRCFSEFKAYQKSHRAEADYLKKMFLSDERVDSKQAYDLVERGLVHTRKVLDKWLFVGICVIWSLLLLLSIGYAIHFCLSSP